MFKFNQLFTFFGFFGTLEGRVSEIVKKIKAFVMLNRFAMKLQKKNKECCFDIVGIYSVEDIFFIFAGSVWCIFLEMNRKRLLSTMPVLIYLSLHWILMCVIKFNDPHTLFMWIYFTFFFSVGIINIIKSKSFPLLVRS